MVILKREILSQKFTMLIWGLAMGFMIALCVFIYPQMKPPGNGISLSGEYSRCASPAKYRGP